MKDDVQLNDLISCKCTLRHSRVLHMHFAMPLPSNCYQAVISTLMHLLSVLTPTSWASSMSLGSNMTVKFTGFHLLTISVKVNLVDCISFSWSFDMWFGSIKITINICFLVNSVL